MVDLGICGYLMWIYFKKLSTPSSGYYPYHNVVSAVDESENAGKMLLLKRQGFRH